MPNPFLKKTTSSLSALIEPRSISTNATISGFNEFKAFIILESSFFDAEKTLQNLK
jgi:hypothetical protein